MASKGKAVGGGSEGGDNSQQTGGIGGVLGSVGDKISSLVGGEKDGDKGEGYIDKGIDAVQQNTVGRGNQDHGPADVEVKDHHVADMLRNQYKSNSQKDGVD